MQKSEPPMDLQQGYERVVEHMNSNDPQAFPVVLVFIDEAKKRLQIGVKKQAEVSLKEVSTQLQTFLNAIPFEVGEAEVQPDSKRSSSQEAQQPLGNRKIRPLQGGTRMSVRQGEATLGFVEEHPITNQRGILTVGHAALEIGNEVGQPNSWNLVGQTENNALYGIPPVDVARVSIKNGIESETYTIWEESTGSIPIRGTCMRPADFEEVMMYGSFSSTQAGQVSASYAAIELESGGKKYILQSVCFATYRSQNGDSGAPVMRIQDMYVCGIHGGSAVYKGDSFAWFTPMELIYRILPLE